MATPDMGKLDLSDSDTEDLFASPSRPAKQSQKTASKAAENTNNGHAEGGGEWEYDAEQLHEISLQNELKNVRSINEVIEGVISSLECAKGNMETVSRTVSSASTLLNTWVRILSQTEHNQRLILNPNWQGATQDLADIENEAVLRVQAAERRAAEEERRREDARRKAEEEERQRQAGTTSRGARGSRGRGRGFLGRSGGVSGSGYGSVSGTNSRGSSSQSRGTSGIGRGIPSARGRARGVR